MNRKSLLIAAFIISFGFFSTNSAKAQIKFGPILGVNFSEVKGNFDSEGMLTGFHIGALLNFGITDFLMIEPQVLYSTKGASGKKTDLNFEYVEIPVWIRYQSERGWNFNAGPYAGLLLSAKSDESDQLDFYKSTDFGLGAGLGYQTKGGIGLAANYSFGLTNIGEDYSLLGQNFSGDAKNACIKISLSFTLGGRRGA